MQFNLNHTKSKVEAARIKNNIRKRIEQLQDQLDNHDCKLSPDSGCQCEDIVLQLISLTNDYIKYNKERIYGQI